MLKALSLTIGLACCLSGCQTSKKLVAPPQPYGATPSEAQVNWQKLQYYMFIHFGPNTFTDMEWGHGDENPKVFNPSQLDAEQWAKTAKAAGMKGIIITAKHHDGFCLWPSKYSTHTVRESAWKDGKGDVLKVLSAACKKYDLKFGVYLSPWDRNHPKYGTDEYNQVFANMLDEVLGNYGEVFEVWFDGANGEGPNGKTQEYDWDLFHKTVYKHNPDAVIFSDVGPGCRWIGNENGIAGTTNWSMLNTEGFAAGAQGPPRKSLNEGDMNGAHWVPGEADVSIRPGWFFSPSTNDKVKSLNHLLKIFYGSVGRNANLLLNVPVSQKGLIHPNDSLRLMELRKTLDATFDENLALDQDAQADKVRGDSEQYSASNVSDGKYDTYWTVNDDVKQASIIINLDEVQAFNRILLQEYIPLGQRVKSFSVEVWDEKTGNFKLLDSQSTIGFKRILLFPMVTTSKIKVTITDALTCPVLSEIQLYKAPEILSNANITRNNLGMVSISTETKDPVITYTIDGSEPTKDSKIYDSPFALPKGGVVKAKTFINGFAITGETVSTPFDVAPAKWSVVNTDDAIEGNEGEMAIDGNSQTFWHTSWEKGGVKEYPHQITIALGETLNLKGFSYTPRQDGNIGGVIFRYNFYVSKDGKTWEKVKQNAEFSNIKNNPIKQNIQFDKTYPAAFIRLEGLAPAQADAKWASAAEIGVITILD